MGGPAWWRARRWPGGGGRGGRQRDRWAGLQWQWWGLSASSLATWVAVEAGEVRAVGEDEWRKKRHDEEGEIASTSNNARTLDRGPRFSLLPEFPHKTVLQLKKFV